jgi:hypothetical protein
VCIGTIPRYRVSKRIQRLPLTALALPIVVGAVRIQRMGINTPMPSRNRAPADWLYKDVPFSSAANLPMALPVRLSTEVGAAQLCGQDLGIANEERVV